MTTARRFKEKMEHLFRYNFFLYKEISKLKKLELLSENEKEELKKERASDLIRYAKSYSPFYRNHYKDHSLKGDFNSIFAALPPLNKKDIRKNGHSIPTINRKFLKKADTSGTSGSPLSVYRSPGSIMRESAYVWNFRMSHGLMPGDPIASMRATLDRNTLYRYNKSDNTLFLSCYLLSKGNIGTYVRVLKEFSPKALCALPSSTYTLVNLIKEQGHELHIPLVFTSSETLYPFQREKIENTLHAKVIDSYGNAERSIQIGQCQHGSYHEFPVYSLNDYCDKGVYTTSLINKSFPLIKYFVDDQLTPIQNACKCGKSKGFSSIEGRYEDVVVLEDGSYITALGMAFRGIDNLLYAQIIQEEHSRINVNLVTTSSFNSADELVIRSKLVQRLSTLPRIDINYIQEHEIIKTCSGKFTLVVSRLLNPQAALNKFPGIQ